MMTWQRFRTLALTQWRVLVICLLAGGIGALLLSKLVSPLYGSVALIQVDMQAGSTVPGTTNWQASMQVAQTAARLASSYAVLQQVAPHYIDLTEDELSQEVSAFARSGTQLVEIEVRDTSPERAASLANDIAAALIQQQLAALKQNNTSAQAQVQQELTRTRTQIAETIAQLNALAASDQTNKALLQAQLIAQEQHYSEWQSTLAQLGMQNTNTLRIVEPAVPEYTALSPDTWRNMDIGFLLGLVSGPVGLILYELLDIHVHTSQELKRLVEWPLLGSIWRSNVEANEQVFNPHGHEMNTEAYCILRTNLVATQQGDPLRTLVVTSAAPGEGKSTVAANLALFLARAGKSTLLIDADLRNPGLHSLFQLATDKVGLSTALASLESSAIGQSGQFAVLGRDLTGATPALGPAAAHLVLEPFFHFVGLPNLRVMPAGALPAHPTEFLASNAMQHLIALLATSGAEFVIFDTPPAAGLADAGILAAKVDGVLVVVDPHLPTKEQLHAVKAALQRVGARVVGCVLNRQTPSRAETAAFKYHHPEPRPQGVAATLAHVLLKKDYPVPVAAVSPVNQEKGLAHTTHHARNP